MKKFLVNYTNQQVFSPPEIGINMDVARIIKEAGYDWTVTDAPVYSAHNKRAIPHDRIVK